MPLGPRRPGAKAQPIFARTPRPISTSAVSLLVLVTPLLLSLAKVSRAQLFMIFAVFTFINVLTCILYTRDKSRSRIPGGWRVNETRLHMCELLGGWPAAFVCQRLLQHKTRKLSYQVDFWGIVVLHEVIWVDIATEGMLRRLVGRVIG